MIDLPFPSDWPPLAVEFGNGLLLSVVVGVLVGVAVFVAAELRG